jgi:Mor family transcriptional regulator
MTPAKTTPEPITELDLVDRIFAYLESEMPEASRAMCNIDRLKAEVRSEFAGIECYIPALPRAERDKRAQDVLRLFNGRNVSEVARQLNIGRTTVYRILKQPGKR